MKLLNIKNQRKALLPLLLVSLFAWVGCTDDRISDSYYTFTGETVASYLKANEDYSRFVSVLERANLLDLLSTYGEFTCFAPTNAAIDSFLLTRSLGSVEELSKADCDTLAKNHLIRSLCFTTDLEDGPISSTNDMGRYLDFTTKTVTKNGQLTLGYFINKTAEMVIRDDTVVNGVVHTLDRVIQPSNLFLPQLMAEDTTISIFVELMRRTGIDKKLEAWIDETYTIGADSAEWATDNSDPLKWKDGPRNAIYPAKRFFGFTAFVEKDVVYERYFGKKGITADEVIERINSGSFVYDPRNPTYTYTYGTDDASLKDSTNVVYRFVAYHILDRKAGYNHWNVSAAIREDQAVYELLDPQDFFETMCPYTMMKFQTTQHGMLYINRRRINEGALAVRDAADPYAAAIEGVRVFTSSEAGNVEQEARNGFYHYVDKLLVYDETTVNNVLKTRFRMDATTLSPDFQNNQGRHRTSDVVERGEGRQNVTRYKPGFVKNFFFTDQTLIGVRNDPDWSPSYQRDGLDFLGQYDFTVKLPPVPQGTYEVRIGINAANDRGIVQIYFDGKGCGIPIDMRIYKSDPRIGAVDDTEDEEANRRNDKDLKNRGYLKGPDSWKTGTVNDANQVTHRQNTNAMRIVLATESLQEGKAHYLRFKSVMDNPMGLFPFDYLELCPKDVYGNPEGEDTH